MRAEWTLPAASMMRRMVSSCEEDGYGVVVGGVEGLGVRVFDEDGAFGSGDAGWAVGEAASRLVGLA
jgi:hypothetical protein